MNDSAYNRYNMEFRNFDIRQAHNHNKPWSVVSIHGHAVML
jgi:hypothetical protein